MGTTKTFLFVLSKFIAKLSIMEKFDKHHAT